MIEDGLKCGVFHVNKDLINNAFHRHKPAVYVICRGIISPSYDRSICKSAEDSVGKTLIYL